MELKPISILLVEDNEDHVELILRALRDEGMIDTINVALDGQEALDYFYNKGAYWEQEKKRYTRPHFILLDIKLPKIDGIEVLKKLKSDPELKEIPVIILTTSENPNDIKNAYLNGANSYISKPVKYDDFKKKLYNLKYYWIETNRLYRTT